MNYLMKANARICAVWLYKDNADGTRIRFWSQVVMHEESSMTHLIRQCRQLDKPISNPPKNCEVVDKLLPTIWENLKEFDRDSLKRIFDESRKMEA